MGKRRKKQPDFISNKEESLDKPDYARDIVVAPQKQKKHVPNETDIFVAERLKNETKQELAKMKDKLLIQQQENKEDSQQKRKGIVPSVRKTAKERIMEDNDLSFAELFDPAPDDELSFEEMMNDSKLDWRKFKD